MNKRLQAAEDRKAALIKHSESIIDGALKANRDYTAEETAVMDGNEKELAIVNETIKRELMNSPHSKPAPAWGGSITDSDSENRGFVFGADDQGNALRAFGVADRFSNADLPPFALGTQLSNWLRGKSSPKLEAFNYGGSSLQGGFLLSEEMSAKTIDLARSASVCMRAGASTVPMETSEMVIARVTGDPTGTWRAEGQAVPASAVTFGRYVLRAKTLAVIVPVSIELLADAPNAGSLIESVISKYLALELDRACLGGIGSESQPLGVRNHPNVNAITSVGTPDDYLEPSESVRDILTENYDGELESLRWIQHPRDGFSYDQLTSALQGQPLIPPPWINRVPRMLTTSIDTTEGVGADESYSIIGDFSQMLVGLRTSGVVFRRLPAGTVADASGKTFNAASQLLEHLVCYLRADVCLMRPSWFSVMSGITASAE